jgi:hypothetical protein
MNAQVDFDKSCYDGSYLSQNPARNRCHGIAMANRGSCGPDPSVLATSPFYQANFRRVVRTVIGCRLITGFGANWINTCG